MPASATDDDRVMAQRERARAIHEVEVQLLQMRFDVVMKRVLQHSSIALRIPFAPPEDAKLVEAAQIICRISASTPQSSGS
jgi:hypothetical protein